MKRGARAAIAAEVAKLEAQVKLRRQQRNQFNDTRGPNQRWKTYIGAVAAVVAVHAPRPRVRRWRANMQKAWSHGRAWIITTQGEPGGSRAGVPLLTVHDAPEWIARAMLKAAERFVAPLELHAGPATEPDTDGGET